MDVMTVVEESALPAAVDRLLIAFHKLVEEQKVPVDNQIRVARLLVSS
jgi:hypothetical protein